MNAKRSGIYIYMYRILEYYYGNAPLLEYYFTIGILLLEYYSAIKNNEILPFTTTWMNLEGIMLSEINQIKINTV